jgi:tetratricopeptide (TPR) repeat protein
VITFLSYSPALNRHKEFTNWDDPTYVTEQKIIQNLNWENIGNMFNTHNPVSLNYHPVTMISLAINYHFSRLNPKPYVLTNIFFHLLNTFLVFLFLYYLSKKKFWLSALSALFFGIHPMHVESVAWVAERKDVLYCFFFLLSCITYLKYLDKRKTVSLILCYLFFILSCLSKAMAVVLPLVLILIDIYYRRKFSWKMILEKLLMFVFALWIGVLAVKIQSAGAITSFSTFTLWQRFTFTAYGFLMYWVKLMLPVGLSAFYMYPSLDSHGNIPFIYYISPLLVLILVLVPLIILYKKNKEKFHMAFWGIGFFIITVALVLQFISVGAAIMADRYSYLPYIGSFFLIFSFVSPDSVRQKTKSLLVSISIVIALVFSILCFQRVKVWENSEKLWTDVIEKYPYVITQTGNVVKIEQTGVETAYKNRGNYYRETNQMDKAFDDYNTLVMANTRDVGDYANMGNFYSLKAQEQAKNNKPEEAKNMYLKSIEMYNKGLSISQNSYDLWYNRGLTYSLIGKHKDAIQDFLKAVSINPNSDNVYGNLAFEYLLIGNYAESIRYCNNFISKNDKDDNVFLYRGTAYVNIGKNNEAISDLLKSIAINPQKPNTWYNLSVAQKNVKQFKDALQSAKKAKELGYNIAPSYLQELEFKAK